MMQQSRVDPGAAVELGRWIKPIAEPEIAIYFGRDLAGEISADAAKAALGAPSATRR